MQSLAIPNLAYNSAPRRILGIDFFAGNAAEAVARMRKGGLLVVPAAPALRELPRSPAYRDALINADLCIPDSAYMVLIWNTLEHDSLGRLSGLEYLRELLHQPDVLQAGNTLWVMVGPESAKTNLTWLSEHGAEIPDEYVYLAPRYGKNVEDPDLVERIQRLRPQHVVITVGGGTQECLGLYLKRELDYLPAIHCIGAAIAFLSGDQVHIPEWVDRFYVGWLFRCISEPGRYFPRYWHARKLFSLMLRYRSELPPLEALRREA